MYDEKEEKHLLNTLKHISSVIGFISLVLHLYTDGLHSIPLLTSVLYSITFNYASSSNYHLPSLREMWQKFKLKTILNVFGTTQLAILRILLLSMQTTEADNASPLFLSYLQLIVAFTDNFTILCQLEKHVPVREVAPRRRYYERYAAAG
ncbi:unnamed protein product [Auanema sp. JU1783]|nr:unnamed protein product [Auanema sp. JU1783]